MEAPGQGIEDRDETFLGRSSATLAIRCPASCGEIEPLPGGLRLVTELSFSVARFALINKSDEIVRAWRVTSTTRLSGMLGAPTLVGGNPVFSLEVSAQQHWEKLIVRLGPTGGTRVRFALPDRPVVGEVNLFAPLRIRADGKLYQLRTNLKTGASVARYSLGPA